MGGAELCILGVDPGLRYTGWGVITTKGTHVRVVASGTLHSSNNIPLPERLVQLSDALRQVIVTYNPDEAAIEETFVNKNALSSLKLGHARGALMLTLSQQGLSIAEYAATLVKKSVTGSGRADKEQIQGMVRMLLPGHNPDSADAADALAVALCHGQHRTISQAVMSGLEKASG